MPRKKQLTQQQEVLPSQANTFKLDLSSTSSPVLAESTSQQAIKTAAKSIYTNALIEEIKALELMNQLCTYITTLRLNKQDDSTIVDEVNSLFSFTDKKIKPAEWKKIMCTYTEIRKAYIRGSLDNSAALSAFISDYLLDYFDSHSNDAKNAILWQKNIDDKIIEQEKIKAVGKQGQDALNVSETTRATLATIAQSLITAPQPDFDSPADEEIEWDSKKDGDD